MSAWGWHAVRGLLVRVRAPCDQRQTTWSQQISGQVLKWILEFKGSEIDGTIHAISQVLERAYEDAKTRACLVLSVTEELSLGKQAWECSYIRLAGLQLASQVTLQFSFPPLLGSTAEQGGSSQQSFHL